MTGGMMATTRRGNSRRFSLIDVIALVAAMAVAFRLGQATMWSIVLHRNGGGWVVSGLATWPRSGTAEEIQGVIRGWFLIATPFLVSLALAVSAITLPRSRAARARSACRPGVAACWAVAFALAYMAVRMVVISACLHAQSDRGYPGGRLAGFVNEMTCRGALMAWLGGPTDDIYMRRIPRIYANRVQDGTLPGFAVLMTWAFLKVSGRFRAEPSWVDRLGRAVGVGWVLAMFARWSWYWVTDY